MPKKSKKFFANLQLDLRTVKSTVPAFFKLYHLNSGDHVSLSQCANINFCVDAQLLKQGTIFRRPEGFV
ncbi:MAG: hypothetical protein EB098_08955 [Betaproteobacteria bacterium]|nr:hypothetical protein [Betaproteobacteria bacterium]